MIDYLSNRKKELVAAEGTLLTVYQELEEKKYEAEVLKEALWEEQLRRHEMNEKLQESHNEAQHLSQKCDAIRRKLTEVQHKLRNKDTDNHASQRELALQQRCNMLEEKISTGCTYSEDDFHEMKSRVSALTTQVELAKDEIYARDSKIQSLERRCRRLDEKKRQVEVETRVSDGYVEEIEQKNKVLETRIKGLTESMKNNFSEIDVEDLQRENKLLKEKLSEEEMTNQLLQEHVKTVKARCENLDRQLADAKASIACLQQAEETQGTRSSVQRGSVSQEESDDFSSGTSSSRLLQAQTYLAEAREKALNIQVELTEKKVECEKLATSLLERNKCVDSLHLKIEEIEHELVLARDRAEELETEVHELKIAKMKSLAARVANCYQNVTKPQSHERVDYPHHDNNHITHTPIQHSNHSGRSRASLSQKRSVASRSKTFLTAEMLKKEHWNIVHTGKVSTISSRRRRRNRDRPPVGNPESIERAMAHKRTILRDDDTSPIPSQIRISDANDDHVSRI